MNNVSKGMEIWNFAQDSKDSFITLIKTDLIRGLGDPTTYLIPPNFKLALFMHLESRQGFEGTSREKHIPDR